MEIDKMIGKRIKNRRKELHLTQKQIEIATGITNGNLSEIENGKYLPSSSSLITLSQILDCSIDWILTGEYQISDIGNSEDDFSDIQKEIISLIKKLPESEMIEIKNFVGYKLSICHTMDLSSTSMNGKNSTKDESIIA